MIERVGSRPGLCPYAQAEIARVRRVRSGIHDFGTIHVPLAVAIVDHDGTLGARNRYRESPHADNVVAMPPIPVIGGPHERGNSWGRCGRSIDEISMCFNYLLVDFARLSPRALLPIDYNKKKISVAETKSAFEGRAGYKCSSRSRPPMAADTLAMNAPIKSASAV